MGLLRHQWEFLVGYLRMPQAVGAILPSSAALAEALCEPLRRSVGPATILEVGAGTGAITRHIGPLLGEHDVLDVCEIQPQFAEILEKDVLTLPSFRSPVGEERVRVICAPVQDLSMENRYDFIISGLPMTAFPLRAVREVFHVLRRCLKPGGVLSYYEYVGLRRTSQWIAIGSKRAKYRCVSTYLTRNIEKHQFERKTVLRNIPPAHARHLRFEKVCQPAPVSTVFTHDSREPLTAY